MSEEHELHRWMPNWKEIQTHLENLNYKAIIPILPSLQDTATRSKDNIHSLISFYSRIYLDLADESIEHLELALSFGIGAAYSSPKLQPDESLEPLALLIQRKTASAPVLFQKQIQLHWDLEKKAVDFLVSQLRKYASPPETLFPCTPLV